MKCVLNLVNSPISKKVEQLPLMEAFYTIQGEGAWQGHAAYFVRLGGCDVGCYWCDVKESWEASDHPSVHTEKIVKMASGYPSRLVVVTGGEPLMYNLEELTSELKRAGFRTHVETSGAYPLSGTWDWVCFSPKKFKTPLPEVALAAHELKVIVFNKSDFSWAEKYAGQVSNGCKLYLQPEWSQQEKMLPMIIDYVKANPQWQISLQVHKYMHIP